MVAGAGIPAFCSDAGSSSCTLSNETTCFARRNVGGGSFSWSCVDGRGGRGGTLKMGSLRELDDLDEECGSTATGVGCGLWTEDILECGCDFCRGEEAGDGPVGETVPALTGLGLPCSARRSSGKSGKASCSLRPVSLSGVPDLSKGWWSTSASSSSLWRRTMPLRTGLLSNAPPILLTRIVLWAPFSSVRLDRIMVEGTAGPSSSGLL